MTQTTPGGKRQLSQSEKRMLLILGIIVVLAGLFFVFTQLGGDEPITVPDTPRTPTPDATETPRERPPETDEAFEGKDPFQPLITPGDGGNGNGNGNGDGTGDGTVVDGGTGEPRVVALVDIFTVDGERFATVTVDGESFTVAEGETFADEFRLLDLTRRCGDFVHGDERFTLCVGQEVRK